jgi:hypothetical protein
MSQPVAAGRSDDVAMLEGVDRHAPRRAELLAPVRELCARAKVTAEAGEFRPRWGPTVLALRCSAEDGSWDAAITVVRARPAPAPPPGVPAQRYTRPPAGYDLDHPGEIVYEVQVTEDDGGTGGHGPRPLVMFELAADPLPGSPTYTSASPRRHRGGLRPRIGCGGKAGKPSAWRPCARYRCSGSGA